MSLLLDASYPEQLDRVLKIFRNSQPVALPTETVYGLAAPLSDEKAIARVFALKQRPTLHPLIVHVLDWYMARSFVVGECALAEKLIQAFWPGPLSLLMRRNSKNVSDLVTGGSNSVVVRSPKHPVFRSILNRWDGPLVAPSANRFAGISPTDSVSVLKELGPYGLEAVVDGGQCDLGLESTIVDIVSQSKVNILRPGALSLEQIKEVLPKGVQVSLRKSQKAVPGNAAKHYSPSKKLYFIESEQDMNGISKKVISESALLKVFDKDKSWADETLFSKKYILSHRNSDLEAASQLFRRLRHLDEDEKFKSIVVCATTKSGLGLAINDRLRRASQ